MTLEEIRAEFDQGIKSSDEAQKQSTFEERHQQALRNSNSVHRNTSMASSITSANTDATSTIQTLSSDTPEQEAA